MNTDISDMNKVNNVNNVNDNMEVQQPEQNNNINTKEIKEFKSFFLQILWRYCSENAFYEGLNSNLLNRSRKIFSSILLKTAFKEELAKYVKNCIMNISLYHLLSTNLTILDMIFKNLKSMFSSNQFNFINQVSSINNEIKDFQSLINYLDKHYYLSGYILQSILDFKRDSYKLAVEIVEIQNLYLNNKQNNYTLEDIISNKFEEKHLNIEPDCGMNDEILLKSLHPLKEEEEKEISKDPNNIDIDIIMKADVKEHSQQNKLIYNNENLLNANNDIIFNDNLAMDILEGNNQINNNNLEEDTVLTENMDHSISTI